MEGKNIFEVNRVKYSSNIPPRIKIGLNQEEYAEYLQLKNDSIPKQVIRDKIQEVNKEYKKYTEKWEKLGMNKEHPFYRYIVRLEAQIDILEELYGKLGGE